MKLRFFVIMLIFNLALGSFLGYLLVVTPEPVVPDEFIDLALEEQAEAAAILSEKVKSKLENFESQIVASAELLKEIFLNRSKMPDRASYYHDKSVINQLGLSLPGERRITSDYNGIEISFDGSAYKISPNAFLESYRDTYLAGPEQVDPLSQVPQDVKREILQTAPLDVILSSLYNMDANTVWLEFTSQKGYSRAFPWAGIPKAYDGRDQAWYSSAITGAKDVMIVLDKSGSMEGDRKVGAINATKNIINSLGGRDRFNIVAFSDRIQTYTDALSLVSSENLEAAANFLDTMVTGGTTNYDLAFTQGLDILAEYGSSRRTPVVVFITDGAPTVGTTDNTTLIEKIQMLDGPVDAQYVLFGIGQDTDHELLKQLATGIEGTHIRINSTDLIEEAISGYREFLSQRKVAAITWSQPYLDTNRQGLVITTSYPVIVNGEIKGVFSSDISLQALSEFVQEDSLSEDSYSFIIDLAGNNIVHPDVNLNVSSNDEIRQPITELETDNEDFLAMLGMAQIDVKSTQIVEYEEGEKFVSLVPIGNTSMIVGVVSPFLDLIPDEVEAKLGNLEISRFAFLPGIGLGFLGTLVMLVMRKRLLKDHEEPLVVEPPEDEKVKEEEVQS